MKFIDNIEDVCNHIEEFILDEISMKSSIKEPSGKLVFRLWKFNLAQLNNTTYYNIFEKLLTPTELDDFPTRLRTTHYLLQMMMEDDLFENIQLKYKRLLLEIGLTKKQIKNIIKKYPHSWMIPYFRTIKPYKIKNNIT